MFVWAGRRIGIALAVVCAMGAAWLPARAATKSANDISGTPAKVTRSKDSPFLIVAFGSSSTEGAGATAPQFTYPAQTEHLFVQSFGAHPGVVVLNRGVGGEDIDDMMKRLDTDVLARKPDVVVWQAGSNDILRNVPVDRFKAKLTAGIAAIRRNGAEVILIEPQRCAAFAAKATTVRFVDAMRAIAEQQHVPLVRRYGLMRDWIEKGLVRPGQLVGRDGLHMTDLGYGLLAKAVFEQVSKTSTRFRATFATLGSWHL